MPNWCKGSLKVRGTKASLKTFILEGLHPVGFLGEEREKLSLNEYGDIYSEETCWIENTRRGFVEGVEVYLSDHEDDEILVVVFDSKFAWGINASEMGMEFNQVIEIIDGKIVKDEELHFKDYQWDCICPKLGG